MKKHNVLVIDDEQIVLNSIKKILQDENYNVELCIRSSDGLEKAVGSVYDLVLSDIRMPDIGGMKILREIKKAKPGLPVVLITGYATVQSAVQAMKLGAEDYLEKPFTPDTLLATVEKSLSRDHSGVPEKQELIHHDEMLRILERASHDNKFVADLFYKGVDALEEYSITAHEKLALLTGDIQWIESYVGTLTDSQRKWLDSRLSAEIW